MGTILSQTAATQATKSDETDAEIDRLGEFPNGGMAMNVEQLDRFFAALIAGPETVIPSEYYSGVRGGRASSERPRDRARLNGCKCDDACR